MNPKKSFVMDVNGHEIGIITQNDDDYISLTDIMKSVDANQKIEKWLSNRWTVDFLGTWEALHNPDFNYPEFGVIRNDAWVPSFTLSVLKWTQKTQAIGIFAKTWKFWWTYAHKDIAFEFASWLSPQFKLYIIKEFQRLKEDEQKNQSLGRDVKRLISKANYRIHTDAIKTAIEPLNIKPAVQRIIYASEAELLNIALFGCTSAEWAKEHPKKAKQWNIRDFASVSQLTVLSNIEILNAEMIKQWIDQEKRLATLSERVVEQLATFDKLASIKNLDVMSSKEALLGVTSVKKSTKKKKSRKK